MSKNKVLLFAVPVFLLLFSTFQNFEEPKRAGSDIDFNSLVDETEEEMYDAKKSAESRKVYYRQLRKAEALKRQNQPEYWVDKGRHSAVLEESVKAIAKKRKVKSRGPASLPKSSVSIEKELVQAED